MSYALFKKKPLKIIRGTSAGPDRPMAAFVDGATADKNTPINFLFFQKFWILFRERNLIPKDTADCATKIMIRTHIKNFETSLFK